MLAERRDPIRAGAFHLHQAAAIGMAGHRGDFNGLAAQRVRYIHVLSVDNGDAIAKMADMIDGETFSHGARR